MNTNNISEQKGTKISEKQCVAGYDKEAFSRFVKSKRKEIINEDGKKGITTRELADMINIDYEQFRKIVNQNKPTKKRDCIIMICILLRLDSYETNEALHLYQYMPMLDQENDRDDVLIDIIEENTIHPLSLKEINERLERNYLPEMDIIDHRPPQKIVHKKKNPKYKILKKVVRTFADDLFFGDQYDSLSTEYATFRYRCVTDMWLDDEKNKCVYHLYAGTDGGNYFMHINGRNVHDYKDFSTIEEAGEFGSYFLEAENMAKQELKRMLSVLDDTKNYQKRISAGVYKDHFHIYAETYNYFVPELSEYYLFEYVEGHQRLSVYKNSEFMHKYYSHDTYAKVFGKKQNEPVKVYNSIAELEAQTDRYDYHLASQLRHFKKLKEDADNLLSAIREKKKYVNRLEYIHTEDPDRVCETFDVTEEFGCHMEADEYESFMCASKKSAIFKVNNEDIEITLDDLYRAYELGFNDIQEICRVKIRLGSIENILFEEGLN